MLKILQILQFQQFLQMGHHQQNTQCLEHPRDTTEWLSQQGLRFWELHKCVSGGDKKSNLKFDIDAHIFLQTSKCQILWGKVQVDEASGGATTGGWAQTLSLNGFCGWFPTILILSYTSSFATRRRQSLRKWAGSKKDLKTHNKWLVIRKKEPPRKRSKPTLPSEKTGEIWLRQKLAKFKIQGQAQNLRNRM